MSLNTCKNNQIKMCGRKTFWFVVGSSKKFDIPRRNAVNKSSLLRGRSNVLRASQKTFALRICLQFWFVRFISTLRSIYQTRNSHLRDPTSQRSLYKFSRSLLSHPIWTCLRTILTLWKFLSRFSFKRNISRCFRWVVLEWTRLSFALCW